MPTMEQLATGESCYTTPHKMLPVRDQFGEICRDEQRLSIPTSEVKSALQAIRDRLLDWALDLEKRGITGEDMNFDEKEKQAAASQTFNIGNIGNFSGVLGNATNSPVTLYDYSSVYQLLKDKGVSQQFPGQYEFYADMGLDEWITLRIEVNGEKAKLFLNDNKQPALVVNDLKHGPNGSGAIGLWVDIGTKGYFTDLNIWH